MLQCYLTSWIGKNGWTPLYVAINRDNERVVKVLVQHGLLELDTITEVGYLHYKLCSLYR